MAKPYWHWRVEFILSSPMSPRLLWMFSLLLFGVFSFYGLLCRLPGQRVVGDESCEEVRRHARVAPKHQAQRLHQHKQAEDVDGRPVVQLHAVLFWGAHHSKKVDERHRRVEGQLHHDAEGWGGGGDVLESGQKHLLNYWIVPVFSHTHRDSFPAASQTEVRRLIWQGRALGLLIPVKHYPPRLLILQSACEWFYRQKVVDIKAGKTAFLLSRRSLLNKYEVKNWTVGPRRPVYTF